MCICLRTPPGGYSNGVAGNDAVAVFLRQGRLLNGCNQVNEQRGDAIPSEPRSHSERAVVE